MGGAGIQSTRVAFFADNAGGIHPGRDGIELVQALAELGEGWDRREFLNLRQKITGPRHTRLGGASLEPSVQGVGHIADLDHL